MQHVVFSDRSRHPVNVFSKRDVVCVSHPALESTHQHALFQSHCTPMQKTHQDGSVLFLTRPCKVVKIDAEGVYGCVDDGFECMTDTAQSGEICFVETRKNAEYGVHGKSVHPYSIGQMSFVIER